MRRRHGRLYERVPRMINPKVTRRTEMDTVGGRHGESRYESDRAMTNQLCSYRIGTLCSFRGGQTVATGEK